MKKIGLLIVMLVAVAISGCFDQSLLVRDVTPPSRAVQLGGVIARDRTLIFPISNPNTESVNVLITLSPEAPNASFIVSGNEFNQGEGVTIAQQAGAVVFITNLENGVNYTLLVTTRDSSNNAHRARITVLATPLQTYGFVCENGVALSGQSISENVSRCQSCSTGYRLNTSTLQCQANAYTCSNGQPASGMPAVNGETRCTTCNTGYLLNTNTLQCDVPTCNTGHHFNTGTLQCQANAYTCSNGQPASGRPAVNGETRCKSCNTDYRLDAGTLQCQANAYTCSNGQPASGRPAVNGEARCASCSSGYRLNGVSCVMYTPYICNHGTAIDGEAPRPNVERCQSCNSGFVLNGNVCNVAYTCLDGSPHTSAVSRTGAEQCQRCNSNFHLDDIPPLGRFCLPNDTPRYWHAGSFPISLKISAFFSTAHSQAIMSNANVWGSVGSVSQQFFNFTGTSSVNRTTLLSSDTGGTLRLEQEMGVYRITNWGQSDTTLASLFLSGFTRNRGRVTEYTQIDHIDMVFNYDDFSFSTDAANRNAPDLISVAIHEFGHALGLPHINDTNAVMYASISSIDSRRAPNLYDRARLVHLYPSLVGNSPPNINFNRFQSQDKEPFYGQIDLHINGDCIHTINGKIVEKHNIGSIMYEKNECIDSHGHCANGHGSEYWRSTGNKSYHLYR